MRAKQRKPPPATRGKLLRARRAETGRPVRMAALAVGMGVEAAVREVPGAVRIPPVEAGQPAAVDVAMPVSAGEAGHAAPGASKVHDAGAARAVPAVLAKAARARRPPDSQRPHSHPTRTTAGGVRYDDRSATERRSFRYGTTIALPTMSPLASA